LAAVSRLTEADAQVQVLDGLLQTVSGKLVSKIKELDILSGDFQNLLEATRAAMIFVDDTLRIRRFTPEVCALYRLTERDIGRSLLDIESYLIYFDLEADVATVRATGSSIDRYLEYRATSGRYALRLAPNNYRNSILGGASLGFRKLNT